MHKQQTFRELYLLCAVIFQMVNTVYMGSMQQMVGDLGIMREDVSFIFLCGVVGVAMPFPILFRLKRLLLIIPHVCPIT